MSSPPSSRRAMNHRPSDPCGSVSSSATECPARENATARFAAIVVLPEPPFCWATQMTCPIGSLLMLRRSIDAAATIRQSLTAAAHGAVQSTPTASRTSRSPSG